MIKIQRLNLDSSWFVHWHTTAFLIDPWLIGSEIDGFPWLNEQWHVQAPMTMEQISHFDFIVISQSYEDHCHLATLNQFSDTIPIIATPKAYHRLKRHFRHKQVLKIPEIREGKPLNIAGMEFACLRPNKWLDPIYYALHIRSHEGKSIFYSPHGFKLNPNQRALLRENDFQLLVTTFTDFRLPAILGGHVNPGLPNVLYLNETLSPKFVLNTHDEEKIAKGIVARFAKIEYPDFSAIQKIKNINFLSTPHYDPIQVF